MILRQREAELKPRAALAEAILEFIHAFSRHTSKFGPSCRSNVGSGTTLAGYVLIGKGKRSAKLSDRKDGMVKELASVAD
jgi:hypothetical protein